MTFDLAALQEIAAKSTGDITLTAVRETGLAGDALDAVGSRPAYRLAVGYTGADGKTATVQSFGAGRVTLGLAYKPVSYTHLDVYKRQVENSGIFQNRRQISGSSIFSASRTVWRKNRRRNGQVIR